MRDLIHQSFLQHLHNTAAERLANYNVYDSYYNGDQDVDIPKKVQTALNSELGTVLNYCRLVVCSAVDYIMGGGVNLEVVDEPVAEEKLMEVYEENRLLTEEMLKTATIMGKKGDVYLKLFIQDGIIKIRVLRPEIVFPRYRIDDYTEMLYCAIKWFELPDDFVKGKGGKWHAQVFRPDVIEFYELEGSQDTQHTSWTLVDTQKNLLGFIPIIHIRNTIDDHEFGISDLQVMTDLQDALNKTITDMLLTMDNQAFQRQFIWGGQTPGEISQEPGTITEYPNPEGHVDVIEPASIEGFLEGMREIIDQMMTVTQMAKMAKATGGLTIPSSGFALRFLYIPLEAKAGTKIIILQSRFQELDQMIFKAMKLLGQGDFVGEKTRLHFQDGLPVDEVSQMEVHEKELTTRIKSRRSVMQERGIEDVDQEMALIEVEDAETMDNQR